MVKLLYIFNFHCIGDSCRSNICLIKNNAATGAKIAVELS